MTAPLAEMEPTSTVAPPEPPIPAALGVIIDLWRQRQDLRRAAQRLDLQGQAVCRRYCQGDKAEAGKLWAKARDNDGPPALSRVLEPFMQSLALLEHNAEALERHLAKLVKTDPLWLAWGQYVAGLGPLSFAGLLAEAGRPISRYRTVSAFWKRMGVAVIDGKRQRKVADAQQALLHGYAPQRAAFMLGVLAPNLMRNQGKEAEAGPYRLVYDRRKAATADREGWSLMHRERDARRVMAKRLLQDAWAMAEKLSKRGVEA